MSKTAEIHKIEGTFRKDRHSEDVKAPMMGEMPEPPTGMSVEAAEWWRKKCIDLKQMGMLYRSDLEILATYCNLLADMDDARKMISESTSAGQRQKWLRYHNEALKYVLPMTKEFGFTPLARTKIRLNPPGERDELDDL